MELDSSNNSTITPTPTTTVSTTKSQVFNFNSINEGENVILDINNGEKFSIVKVKRGLKTRIGKKQINISEIIGKPWFSSFQVVNETNTLKIVTQKELDDALNNLVELNQNDADNRNLDQNNTAQKLTQEEITKMKESGTDSNTIIKTIVENSSSFQTKTAYSQIKYLKKKIKKYSTIVKVIKPTSKSLTEAYYKKDARKICNLRFDSFGQLLTLANIRSGTQVLVVETCMGLVTGSIAERMGGEGTILSGFIGKGASLSIVNNFGFQSDVLNTIYPFNINLINKLNKKEDISEIINPTVGLDSKNKNKRQDNNKEDQDDQENGEEAITNQKNDTSTNNISKLLNDGTWSLVIVTKYSPLNILLACWPYLNASGNFVIFSQFPQPLIECHQFLHSNQMAINQQISEIWMREYQVLPKRTHPTMGMDGASGYLLSGIKVNNITKPTIASTTTTTTTNTTTTTPPSSDPLDIEKQVINSTTTTTAEEDETSESVLKKRKLDEEEKN
ncbi:hypothetical protein DICPUDRAFT_35506 [Dictyostelium purpureum]|uniref:tRNA (adenine(58)-N(1))-methyltransferase non-catalytic subunit TRM6 n=1 Tax=Dictyostelium purpureum TaxID=5786 RepID=F0ZPF8_DICPU|nr:uncharacterized protein DICPUDRAFT_35506 [Dictyostelium purpureum]EGC34179.1 hypothetical protein DICPUDRAFT_35506 [Dictyostelium purpureum]|eukprot:XP_003289283.1 hypothetical protein DICPUDRAFT_35506 [Dictyostelium purpureum]